MGWVGVSGQFDSRVNPVLPFEILKFPPLKSCLVGWGGGGGGLFDYIVKPGPDL